MAEAVAELNPLDDFRQAVLAIEFAPFEERFALMRDLYVSLPWGGIKEEH